MVNVNREAAYSHCTNNLGYKAALQRECKITEITSKVIRKTCRDCNSIDSRLLESAAIEDSCGAHWVGGCLMGKSVRSADNFAALM